ncbi:MAG: LLM class F420-dependent oxidoreductase [Acidimicrobiia bacterium]
MVELGIVTPVVTMLPRAHARWEEAAGIAEIERCVVAADRLGYHHATCSEHVAIPTNVAPVRGSRYWDPLATLGYLAARTQTIRLATHVLVLGYHHPLEIAKRYGTLDQVSGGRLILGVGVGSLREEFELLGAEFEARGARGDDALRALRASLSQAQPRYNGQYYHYEGMVLDPCAAQPRVPIWIGGRTARSLRRAVELADGWAPFGLRPDEMAAMLTRARAAPAWSARADDAARFDVVLQPEQPLDPGADADAAFAAVAELVAAGATIVNVRMVHRSPTHYIDQLEALQTLMTAA